MRQLADAQGYIIQRYDYSPFGEVVASEGKRSSALQYTDEQNDLDTGLIYLRARWYDPSTGRFTTRDPFPGYADLPQTLNPYVYALNNPINLTDPSGEIPIDTVWDLFVLFIDAILYLADAINPSLDQCTREQLLLLDLAALGADGLALLTPYFPGGSGLVARMAGRGGLVLVQGGARIIQVGVKGAQVGAHASAMTKGSGSGRGSSRYTQGGERLTDHGEDRLEREVNIDDVIKNYSQKYEQADGAEAFVKRVGKNKYDVVIRGDGGIVTTLKDQTRHDLDNLARNYGWW